jgi:hypothetical protein
LNPLGNQLLYQTEVNGITNLLIQDFNTEEFDTIKTTPVVGSWCWIDTNRIFYAVWRNTSVVALCVFDIKTRQETELQELSVGASIALLIANTQYLKKDNSIIWCAYKTVGKTNINTGENKVLLNAFDHEVFFGLSVVGEEGDLVLNKRIIHMVDSCHMDSENDFYLINVDKNRYDKIGL